ncbi:hypothetical protein M427DRAFT_36427 [Gonapodya prolifera JEL478]|uniref:SH3 domain-containing protein n=1 Tax=Gonapodya prolifera (strain JEL478) TaxID=1344416 RepID=A0A139A2N6_GONPJ|nr:hypothetical protein M427DRAFT_36427 [Gonapodya prolifera JEL478]|eukprot:KXS10959.1 hypothetical protein M427DRAFT_36427 [Gonapodya prolifera JEL478]
MLTVRPNVEIVRLLLAYGARVIYVELDAARKNPNQDFIRTLESHQRSPIPRPEPSGPSLLELVNATLTAQVQEPKARVAAAEVKARVAEENSSLRHEIASLRSHNATLLTENTTLCSQVPATPQSPRPPTSVRRMMFAIADYEPNDADEIGFAVGDGIFVNLQVSTPGQTSLATSPSPTSPPAPRAALGRVGGVVGSGAVVQGHGANWRGNAGGQTGVISEGTVDPEPGLVEVGLQAPIPVLSGMEIQTTNKVGLGMLDASEDWLATSGQMPGQVIGQIPHHNQPRPGNHTHPMSMTALNSQLIDAVEAGCEPDVKRLIDAGASPDARKSDAQD